MQTGRHKSGNRRAFTLIEVLIVIAILLAIGGLLVVNLLPAKDQADIDTQKLDLERIGAALNMFRLDMKRYPTTEEGLAALSSKDALADDANAANWKPYLEDPVLKDKWGHEIVYRFPGEIRGETTYDLISFGPDGQEGTGDDITNHDRHKGEDGEIADDGGMIEPPPPMDGGGG